MSAASLDGFELPRWRSLRWRLPVVMSGLIAAVVALSLWMTTRELGRVLLRTGGERAMAAADQVSAMMAQGATRGLNEMRRVAADDAVRRLLAGDGDAADAARKVLTPLAIADQPPVELRNVDGALVLAVTPARGSALALDATIPLKAGLSPIVLAGKTVFYGVVAEIVDRPGGSPAATAAGRPLGFLVVRRALNTAQTADTLNRLLGDGATVAIGHQTEGVWTNFSGALPPPPVDKTRRSVTVFQSPEGDVRIGALSVIAGTPWASWIEFRRDRLLEPAVAIRRRLTLTGLGMIVVAAVLVSVVSGRITRPLQQLSSAAGVVATGGHQQPVETGRRDEIGRLGAAFNAMSTRVESARRDLEQRVAERTATLSEARAVLEQRVAELNLARAELDRFFSVSIDLFCIADCNGRLLRVNPSWEQTLGWTTDELTARPYLDFVHPEDRASTSAEAAALADGSATMQFENRYRTKDGSYRWLSWHSAPAVGEGRIYAAARDVTTEKQVSAALERNVVELKAINDELESFTYSVSHDLRAPLRHVTGFASMLEKSAAGHLSETESRYLRTIVDAATRMGRLIDDLLTFSRMGRSALSRERVNLDVVVADALQEIRGDRTDAVEWTIRPLPQVVADPAMLRLALINLLANAVKYSAGRERPAIEVGEDGSTPGETVIYVRDNGVGFDMQYAHKLFGVFQRLHTADEFEGTGIGLANVRRIVNRHGGRVWAEAAVDRGATFFVALPRGAAELS